MVTLPTTMYLSSSLVIIVSWRIGNTLLSLTNASMLCGQKIIELIDTKAIVDINRLTDYYYDMAYEGKWHDALQYMADGPSTRHATAQDHHAV